MVRTVAADGWSVSRHIKYGPGDPPGGVLHVSPTWRSDVVNAGRGFCERSWPKGDHDGRKFMSEEQADRFCLEHGYTQPYVNKQRAVFKRVHRAPLAILRQAMVKGVATATSYDELLKYADSYQRAVYALTDDDIFTAMSYMLGVLTYARRVRPELFKRRRK